jgi:flagellar protein FliO/FliZ
MPAGSATGSLLQTLFALIVVLGVLGALAWFLKRYGPKAMGGSANLRVVGSLNLGGRERLLVVEIGNQWIVVGASPGRVNALATMPKQEQERAPTWPRPVLRWRKAKIPRHRRRTASPTG